MPLRGVIFDLDGTVVENDYDWPGIRDELGTGGASILHYLESLEEPERAAKWAILESHEARQTGASVLRRGVRELLAFLQDRRVAAALVTNNSRRNTEFLLAKFRLDFDCVVTRESGLWKPSGAPFLEVLRTFGLAPEACAVVGDTRFDILAALDAGIGAIFLLSCEPERFAGLPVEVCPDLEALRGRLESLLAA
ncbi:MAG TPA: HAD-IA family hydrolase [Candidatus Aminicenantes bacterium]|nr:HAD-IA family hydrolase [Candidatus Aminicenantes bacterium]